MPIFKTSAGFSGMCSDMSVPIMAEFGGEGNVHPQFGLTKCVFVPEGDEC